MFQISQIGLARLDHHHGGDEWHEMHEVSSAELDPERSWGRGRIFRCTACEDEIRVVIPDGPAVQRSKTE